MKRQIEVQEQRLQQLETEQTTQQRRLEADKASQQRRVETEEATQQRRIEAAVKQTLEAQPAQVVLGAAPMPPSAFGVGVFGSIDFDWVGFYGVDTYYAATRFQGGERTVGKLRTVDVDREFAPRFGAGVHLPAGWGVVSFSFQRVEAEGEDEFKGTRLVGPFAEVFDTINVQRARAKNEVELNQLDFQWQYPVQLTNRFVLTPEVGLRAIWFEQKVSADYFDGAGVLQIGQTWKTDSRGVGPKIGLGASLELFPGLFLDANASGGYLLGGALASQQFCRGPAFGQANPCDRAGNWNMGESRGIPFVDGEFKIRYAFGQNSVLRGLNLWVAYRAGTFFDLTSEVREEGSFEPDHSTVTRKNVTRDSIGFGIKYIF